MYRSVRGLGVVFLSSGKRVECSILRGGRVLKEEFFVTFETMKKRHT